MDKKIEACDLQSFAYLEKMKNTIIYKVYMEGVKYVVQQVDIRKNIVG